MPVPVVFPLAVEVSSPHVPGSFAAFLLDARELVFPTSTLVDLLVACHGSWRLRQDGAQWQEHGPNTDWTELQVVTMHGQTFHGLHSLWAWQLSEEAATIESAAGVRVPMLPAMAGPAGPSRIPRPRRERNTTTRSHEPSALPTVSA